ncbi:MAG TPA: substrate-binding domain-containing protein [Bryobacteraceae bacterium]|jgi:ribose transport system substrate-binding protein|nr:substrate-binding domain-containing protein [Bryobacteraceae bacterium]
MVTRTNHSRYLIKSIVHASDVLSAFRSEGEVLRLRDVVVRTGFNKGMCFRLLYTLHSCGFLEKVGENQYRAVSEIRTNRKYRIGYAAQGQDSSFPREVASSLVQAAEGAHVELVVVDNRYNAKTAVRNADQLIREEVDLVIEFQADDAAAPAITRKFMEANIPMIAIDIPHPGATYFGANNYEAGLIGGRHLGRWANKHWEGVVEEIVVVEISRSGSVPQQRIGGMLAGINETLRHTDTRIIHIDGDGQFRTTLECIRKHLRTSKAKRILVGAATDPSALGALRAFQEAGRTADCAVVGHNAEPDGRAELREPRTRLIGSVAYFPEKYGPGVIRLALDILARKATPPAMFIRHLLITPENVDHFYPNDNLMGLSRTAPTQAT